MRVVCTDGFAIIEVMKRLRESKILRICESYNEVRTNNNIIIKSRYE